MNESEAWADEIEGQLRRVGSPERAATEQRYLKSELKFLGATVRQIGRSVKAFALDHPALSHQSLVQLVTELWSKPVHERRMVAVKLLEHYHTLLVTADLPWIERLIRESKTWAYVDVLAGDVVGRILLGDPGAAVMIDAWAVDADLWLRRSALLAELLPLRVAGSLRRFGRRADLMLDEKEFFIRKAIGWVLREAGKRHPQEVVEWLAPRAHRASGVTMREAVKYLPAADALRLMEAHREKRPAALA